MAADAPRSQLSFVDAGLVVRLSATDRANFLALFQAIAQGDGAQAGRLMLARSRSSHSRWKLFKCSSFGVHYRYVFFIFAITHITITIRRNKETHLTC